MNTDEVRAKFEKTFKPEGMYYNKLDNSYELFQDSGAGNIANIRYNAKWQGYQQATKDSDLSVAQLDYNFDAQKDEIVALKAENERLRNALKDSAREIELYTESYVISEPEPLVEIVKTLRYYALKEANHDN